MFALCIAPSSLLPFSHSPAVPPLAALTPLSWPSGPHPWLWLVTTSPTEIQIGWHTMPQILIHQHNAITGRTLSLLFNSLHIHSVRSLIPLAALSLYFWQLGVDWWADNRNLPYSRAGQHEQDEPELTKPLPSETKVVCSIIQTGATPTAASATLTLTNGQKNRWFVHS